MAMYVSAFMVVKNNGVGKLRNTEAKRRGERSNTGGSDREEGKQSAVEKVEREGRRERRGEGRGESNEMKASHFSIPSILSTVQSLLLFSSYHYLAVTEKALRDAQSGKEMLDRFNKTR